MMLGHKKKYINVCQNGGTYMVTRHQCKINFKYCTYICEIGEVAMLKHGFKFIPFNNILSRFAKSDYLVGMWC